MFESKIREALRFENSVKIINVLLKFNGLANFSTIERISGVKGGVLKHHLSRLSNLGFISKSFKGIYRLRYKGIFYTVLNFKRPCIYLGLLGRRNNREIPETLVALKLLGREGVECCKAYVVTTSKALSEWEDVDLNCSFTLCSGDEISDVNTLRGKTKSIVEEVIEDYPIVMDCTGATKPATIAFYDVASSYLIPLMYVTEDGRLKWIISRENIIRRLNITLYSGATS